MDARSLLFVSSQNAPIPTLLNPKNSLSFSLVQSCKLSPFSAKNLLAPQTLWHSRRLEYMNSVQKVKHVVHEEDTIAGIKKKNLAVFVSGGGSNFWSIHDACVGGSIHGDVAVLVTNRLDCGGAEYARDKGIPVILFPKSKDEANRLSLTDLVAALRGYYGMKVHNAFIASGARYSGPTIHFVDEHYDTGRILAQRVVPVLWNDTVQDLAARVLQEHRPYAEVVAALCEERVIWREDGSPIIQSKEDPNENN